MGKILDDLDSNTNSKDRLHSFRFLSIGLLIGLALYNTFGSLRLIILSLLFRLNIFGITNNILMNLISLIGILILAKLIFDFIAKGYLERKNTLHKIKIYSIIFLIISLIVEAIIPIITSPISRNHEHMGENLAEIGQFWMIHGILEVVGYLGFILFTSVIILNSGKYYLKD